MRKISSQPYEQSKQYSVNLCNEVIEVVTKPGLPDWDQLQPSAELLAKYPKLLPSDRVLLMGSHHGALSVYIARQLSIGQLPVMDNNYIALEMTHKTLEANHISSVDLITNVNLPETVRKKYDTVFIQIPKGRKLMRRWLLQAYQAIKDGGSVYISGSNLVGIQSSIKDAEKLFGNGYIMAYKKGNRISHQVKQLNGPPLPEWAHSPGIVPGTWIEFSVSISDRCYQIHSLPGVFSFDHLDVGTEMLLSIINIIPESKVLDVGCGYGMIGLFAASQGAYWVDLIDSDLLAIAACKETLANNQISNTRLFTGDLLDPIGSSKYDLILSNPPFHAGQAVDYQIAEALFRQSYQALNPDGRLSIVANRFIPYDRIIKEIFGNMSCLRESGRFQVLSANKSG
jgi:16S rRNA (guanine1207-N2)-methyltransferase